MEKRIEINENEIDISGISITAPTKEIQKKLLEKSLIRNWLVVISDSIGFNKLENMYFTTPILNIEMPCGNKVEYLTMFDVPTETTMCPCGNPNHYLLKFEIK